MLFSWLLVRVSRKHYDACAIEKEDETLHDVHEMLCHVYDSTLSVSRCQAVSACLLLLSERKGFSAVLAL